MFTGIIETVGEVVAIKNEGTNKHFKIASKISNELKVDQSVSHDGVCLTVVWVGDGFHWVVAIQETLQKSNLGSITEGDKVNLERCIQSLPAGFRKVFVLHDIQGYRHREIANLLGRSVGDSKSQLHKARKRLRESLRELQRDKTRDARLMAATNRAPTESAFAGQT